MNYWLFFSTAFLLILLVVHLYFCFYEKEKGRKITKCFLMPALILILASMKCRNILIYTALLLSTIGDALLIKKDNKMFFIVGALAFLLSHVCYLTFMHTYFENLDSKIFIIVILLIIILILVFYKVMKKYLQNYTLACFMYAFSLMLELVSAIVIACNYPTFWAFILISGVSLFIISESILTYTIFIKDVKRRDLYIMSTYVAAQIAIACSLFFL